MKSPKKISVSLLIFILLFAFASVSFLLYVYFKTNTDVINPKKVEIEVVDSLLLIQQRDSTIESLNKDNYRLKEMYDQKHDTIFVPRIIYKVKEPDIVKPSPVTDN